MSAEKSTAKYIERIRNSYKKKNIRSPKKGSSDKKGNNFHSAMDSPYKDSLEPFSLEKRTKLRIESPLQNSLSKTRLMTSSNKDLRMTLDSNTSTIL